MLKLLIRPHILSLKNSINAGTALRRLPFIALGAGFWLLFYAGTYKVLSYIRAMDFLGEILSERLFSMTLFSLTGFLILSNVITALSSFYLSRDLPFLLSKPIEIRDIIRLKTLESVLISSWMVISFIPPVYIAYGVSYGAPSNYYISLFAALLMFIFITAGIGISMAHILTRLFPAKRSREVLLGLMLVLFLALYLLVKSAIPHDLNTPEDIINSFIKFKADWPALPGYWITKAILPVLNNKEVETFYMFLLLSNSAFFLFLSSLLGSKLYRGNLEKIQPSAGRSGRGPLKGLYPTADTAVLYKDMKIFFRDTGQWSQLFIIGALFMVYIFNFRSVPFDALSGLSPFIIEIMALVNMVMAGLVLSAVTARFLFTAVSLEGRAFWVIKTSPVNIRRFLWSKFLYGCIPVTFIMVLLVFLTNSAMGVKGLLMPVSIGSVFLLCLSISGLGTGMGSLYPQFKYENIASVSMSLGGMSFMLIAFSLVIVTLSLEAWVFYLYKIRAAMGSAINPSEKIQIAVCLISILAINAAALYLPMRVAGKRLQEMQI